MSVTWLSVGPRARRRTLARRALVASVAVASGACASAPARVPDASSRTLLEPTAAGWARPVGAAILVRFPSPEHVAVARPSGAGVADSAFGSVQALTGRLRASRGDTLWVEVTSVRLAGDAEDNMLPARRAWTARLERHGPTFEVISANPQRVERMAGVATLGTVGVALLVATWCMAATCSR